MQPENGTANPHLNLFEPYRELSSTHEDQLTRAAMIVLRLVPLAREALLRAIGECSQSELPDCVLDMQATNVVDPTEEGAMAGKVRRGRLVSVFLTPDTEPVTLAKEVKETQKGQRFDGVLRFDPELVIVLESKVCRSWARRNGHRAAELNLGGARFGQSRTFVLRWHDLLESWWRLAELGVLSPAEQAVIQDMLSYAHQDFGHLLPFGSLRRVGADPVRRKWRLRSLLREATSIEPERAGLVHVRLDVALGARSLQRAAVEAKGDQLVLHLWPGELKRQAEHLYTAGHADALNVLSARGEQGWRIEPQPLLGFRNAPVRTRVYLTCSLDAETYSRRWQGEDWDHVGAHHRDKIRSELLPWLIERRYASPEDEARLDPFLHALGRRFAHLRPSIHISRAWPLVKAVELDDQGLLAGELRDSIDTVLSLLDEPPLPKVRSPRRRPAPLAEASAAAA